MKYRVVFLFLIAFLLSAVTLAQECGQCKIQESATVRGFDLSDAYYFLEDCGTEDGHTPNCSNLECWAYNRSDNGQKNWFPAVLKITFPIYLHDGVTHPSSYGGPVSSFKFYFQHTRRWVNGTLMPINTLEVSGGATGGRAGALGVGSTAQRVLDVIWFWTQTPATFRSGGEYVLRVVTADSGASVESHVWQSEPFVLAATNANDNPPLTIGQDGSGDDDPGGANSGDPDVQAGFWTDLMQTLFVPDPDTLVNTGNLFHQFVDWGPFGLMQQFADLSDEAESEGMNDTLTEFGAVIPDMYVDPVTKKWSNQWRAGYGTSAHNAIHDFDNFSTTSSDTVDANGLSHNFWPTCRLILGASVYATFIIGAIRYVTPRQAM